METPKKKKKLTIRRKFRRWKRRMAKKYPNFKLYYALAKYGAIALAVLLAAGLSLLLFKTGGHDSLISQPTATPSPTPHVTPVPTPVPTATPSPTPEPVYIDGVEESLYYQSSTTLAPGSDPDKNKLVITKVYKDGEDTAEYTREGEIQMGPGSEYTQLEGITTFRGSNYRDSGAYGMIPEDPSKLSVVWSKKIRSLDEWSGVGWTGQASAVRWSDEMRNMMNINSDKKKKEGLVEVMYATLDGRIYFLDLDDGKETRDVINIGAPIKGSLTIDPRGYPLLYCGQGIYDVEGKRVDCGTRIWSLIDQKLLYFLNGKDSFAVRPWRAFDCAPLINAGTDTMITVGENGVLYSIDLNTKYEENKISISPVVDRYVYKQSIDGKVGSENSLAIYNNYAYFATNIGIVQCVDLNTMELVWCFNAQDDIDASLVIEVEESGTVALYGANEQDIRGKRGESQMFKLDALTGELLWYRDSDTIHQNNDNGGGSFATPCIGKQGLKDLVYFHVARTVDSGGMLYALNKQTGETVWSYNMGAYGWATPTCVYTPSGKGYLLVGSSNGLLRMFDGLTGKVVAKVDLGSNIEATPVVFEDMIIVGTRGEKIFGIRIK